MGSILYVEYLEKKCQHFMNFPQQLNERGDIDLSNFQTIQNVTLRIALKNVNIATNGKVNNDPETGISAFMLD